MGAATKKPAADEKKAAGKPITSSGVAKLASPPAPKPSPNNQNTPRPMRPKPRLRPNTKEARKPRECVEIVELLDSIGQQITLLRQMLEATGGQFSTHRFDLPEQVKRLNFARSIISQVRASTKGE